MPKKTSDQDLIELSGNAVYEDNLSLGSIETNPSYEIVDICSTQSGLDAITVLNLSTQEYIIVYQGTQTEDNEGNDVLTDAMLVGNQIPQQYTDANNYYNDVNAHLQTLNPPNTVSVVAGNSLGGGLANHVAIHNPGVYSVTLNPAILPGDDLYDAETANTYITNYCSLYDPLTLAEISAGYGNRLPGNVVPLNSGLPTFLTMGSNHVGYPEEDYVVGKQGESGFGSISMDADDFLMLDIWGTGTTSPGAGTKIIHIDANHLIQLVAGLDNVVINEIKEAKKYLDNSAEIVIDEGDHLDNRRWSLESTFDEIFKESGFSTLVRDREEIRNDSEHAVKRLTMYREDLIGIPGSSALSGTLSYLRAKMDKVSERIDDVQSAVKGIKENYIPTLFHGINSHFFSDGIVEELKAHYQIIDDNNDQLVEQVTNFRDQVFAVQLGISETDQALASGKIPEVMKGPASIETFLEPSPYLVSGMAIKEQQMFENYHAFVEATAPAMVDVFTKLCALFKEIEELSAEGIDLVNALLYQLEDNLEKPLTRIPAAVEDILYSIKNALEQYQLATSTLSGALLFVDENVDDILYAFRPFVETALFDGTRYHDVLMYNHASLGILNTTVLTFKDIQYQLAGNQSVAIEALSNHSNNVLKNINQLIEQVQISTLT